jgi:hypothetical protein
MAKRGATVRSDRLALGDPQVGEKCFEVHGSITPNGAVRVNTVRCSPTMSTPGMDEEAKARVDRLVEWCSKHKIAMSEDGKTFAQKQFAELAVQNQYGGGESYWLGILGKQDRSFGAKKARAVEAKMGMPTYYLDGGAEQKPKGFVSKLTDLNEQELELVMLYRGMSPDHKHELSVLANQFHNLDHPGPSAANPYANAPAPGAPKSVKERK